MTEGEDEDGCGEGGGRSEHGRQQQQHGGDAQPDPQAPRGHRQCGTSGGAPPQTEGGLVRDRVPVQGGQTLGDVPAAGHREVHLLAQVRLDEGPQCRPGALGHGDEHPAVAPAVQGQPALLGQLGVVEAHDQVGVQDGAGHVDEGQVPGAREGTVQVHPAHQP